MKYSVVLTDKAETDVESVLMWFRDQRAIRAGTRWLADLMSRLAALESNPDRCRLAEESEDVHERIFELSFGSKRFKHRLLFRIVGQTVQIIRVWHSSRDRVNPQDL